MKIPTGYEVSTDALGAAIKNGLSVYPPHDCEQFVNAQGLCCQCHALAVYVKAQLEPTDHCLYDDDICPGHCDFDAQDPYQEHKVIDCGGPWKRQHDLRRGSRSTA